MEAVAARPISSLYSHFQKCSETDKCCFALAAYRWHDTIRTECDFKKKNGLGTFPGKSPADPRKLQAPVKWNRDQQGAEGKGKSGACSRGFLFLLTHVFNLSFVFWLFVSGRFVNRPDRENEHVKASSFRLLRLFPLSYSRYSSYTCIHPSSPLRRVRPLRWFPSSSFPSSSSLLPPSSPDKKNPLHHCGGGDNLVFFYISTSAPSPGIRPSAR
jgi:hypothetical protein